MAKLIVSVDNIVFKEYTIVKERTTIGRKAENDLHIEDERLSGAHAVIVRVGGDFILEDLGSTNGTMVKGKPIKRYLLKHDDVIDLGDYKINFVEYTNYNEDNFLFSRMVRPPKTS